MSTSNPIPFKRVTIGAKFTKDGTNYRKVDNKRAFRLKPNGVGETHSKIHFTRSANVALVY